MQPASFETAATAALPPFQAPVSGAHPLFHDAARRRARTTLLAALGAGVVTQALFFHAGLGLNWFVWDVLAVAANVVLFRRAALRAIAWGAIAAAILLGFSVFAYASTWALSFALPANLFVLAALPLVIRDQLSLAEIAWLPWVLFTRIAQVPKATAQAASLPAAALEGPGRMWVRGLTRGLVLGLPTAGLFTLLLSTDAEFSEVLVRAKSSLGDAAGFVFWTVACASAYAVTHTVIELSRRRAQPVVDGGPYRVMMQHAAAPPPVAGRVGVITWAMVVGQVALVFATFVAVNVRHLFGGHGLVRAEGSTTYASYLHAGFAQLLFASALSVCLVVVGHALVRPRGETKVPGGAPIAALESTLLALTGITLASCAQRLAIYEDAYGATHLRLGVGVILIFVLGVLALTIGKAVFRGWNGHGGAVIALGVVASVLASGINADAYVARTNLDRAAAGKALDTYYLESLSSDACVARDHAMIAADPKLAASFDAAWTPRAGMGLRDVRGFARCPAVAP